MLDDATLVERCLQGDAGAFDTLVARYLEQAAKAAPPAPTLEERLYAREQRRTVQRLLMRLPAPQRAAMLLYYYEELPVADVARALNAPEGTVKTWLYRGRETLRRWLEEELG